jgi:hypothetical protein
LQEEAKKRQGTRTDLVTSLDIPDSTLAPIGAEVVKGKAIEIAAKALQVGTGTIDRAMQVKKANPELFEQIKQGKIARGCEGLLRLDVVQDDRALLPRKPSCHASRSGSAGREAPRTDEAN